MDVVDSSALPGCYLLVIVGEPYTEQHKRQILQKISKGLLSWDVTSIGCDLSELQNVCSNVKPGSEPENELLIQHSTETLAVEVLLNPQVSTLKQCLKNLLLATTGHKHLIYAGYSFTGSGSWILQNGTFQFSDFTDAFQDEEIQKELQNHANCTFHIHCNEEGDWTSSNLQKQTVRKLVKVELNPPDKIDSLPGSSALIQCLDLVLVSYTLEEMMTLSPLVGNIRFNRPTLYVFPGGQGDCALFGINGFNMLIDGGFNRKPCFWEFIRHLDRLDAVMVTRLCESNLCGITTMMKRKAINNIYPQIGYVFCNAVEGKTTPNEEETKDKDDLLVSVLSEGHSFLSNLTELKMKPHRCFRDDITTEPFTLYQKVGHGTLEMYTLSPQKDSKEVKEFLQQWASRKETFSRVKTGVKFQEQEISIPLSHALSICSLVVWKPANPKDTITRIFFPGSAPQNRIFEGLEKLKNLSILKHRTCSQWSLQPTPVEKPKSKTLKGSLTKSSVTATSHIVSNGTRRSSESLTKKDVVDSELKKESVDKKAPKPVKKEVAKVPPETKEKKEIKRTTVTATSTVVIKKEAKEKKPLSNSKPSEVKKTTSPPKVAEVKSKGLKEVTNKNTIETKNTKKKMEPPKSKLATQPVKTVNKSAKPNASPTKTQSKVSEVKKILPKSTPLLTATKKEESKPVPVKKSEKVKSTDKTKENLGKKEIEVSNELKADISNKEKIEIENEEKLEIVNKEKKEMADEEKIENGKEEKIEIAKEEKVEIANQEKVEITKEITNEEKIGIAKEEKVETLKENIDEPKEKLIFEEDDSTKVNIYEEKPVIDSLVLPEDIQDEIEVLDTKKISEELPLQTPEKVTELEEEKQIDEDVPEKVLPIVDGQTIIDNDISALKKQAETDLLLANASMEGSFCEGLMGEVQDEEIEEYLQKGSTVVLESAPYQEEKEIKSNADEIIEEKSEKESLRDMMALENKNEETAPEDQNKEVKSGFSINSDEYKEKYVFEKEIVIIQDEKVPVDVEDEEDVAVSTKEMLTVKIPNENEEDDDDDDVVKSPTPVAIVDYEDEGVAMENDKLADSMEKYDAAESERLHKESEHYQDEALEMDRSEEHEEKESLSFSEEEKLDDDDDEEMIRHPTPPGERNFYEKIGATADDQTHLEELDTRFMEHYLPVTREACQQPLYEEAEDDDEESDSESPIVEQPVYSNVGQADFPEFVNISGGTTPSEPQSPKALHDSKHRMADVSEQLFKGAPPQEIDEEMFEEEQKLAYDEISSEMLQEKDRAIDFIQDEFDNKDSNLHSQEHASSIPDDTLCNLRNMVAEESIIKDRHIIRDDEAAQNRDYMLDDQNSPLQEHDSIFTYEESASHEQDVSKEHLPKVSNTEEEGKEHEDVQLSRDIYYSESTIEYQQKQIYTNTEMPNIGLEEQETFTTDYQKIPDKAHSSTDEESDVQEQKKLLTQAADSEMFSSHPMDQSFHESYIETAETEVQNMKTYLDNKECFETSDPYSSYTIEEGLNIPSADPKQTGEMEDDHSDVNGKYAEHKPDVASHSNVDYPEVKQSHFIDKDYPEMKQSHFSEEDYPEVNQSHFSEEDYSEVKQSHFIDKDYSEVKQSHFSEKDYPDVHQSYFSEKEYSEEISQSHFSGKIDEFRNNLFKQQNHSDLAEEDLYGDNEQRHFGDIGSTKQVAGYSFQATTVSSSDGDRKETYCSVTNGVNLPTDINGHQVESWKEGGLLNYENSSSMSYHHEDLSKNPYYDDEDCDEPNFYGTIPPVSESLKKSIVQTHYTESTNIDDIYLEHKDHSQDNVEKGSYAFAYNNKDYRQEDQEPHYSENVPGVYETQKEPSSGFHLDDWSKPMGLPSPPDSKLLKSTPKSSPVTKLTRTEKKPRTSSIESVKSTTQPKSSPKNEKLTKTKMNGLSSPPPVYVDLAYVPHHGDPHYSNVEFFKRIRARYYVFSGINPSKDVLNALLEAKKAWKDDSEVTIIPTYETDALGYWMALNQDTLMENKIDVAPSASRCTVNLQDHETSCAAYRLEF